MKPLSSRVLPFVFLLFQGVALAHSPAEGTGFVNGVMHPVGGLDHLLAMVAVGLWAAQCGSRTVWMYSAAFIAMMTMGGLLGMAGVTLPFLEAGILASVVIFGLLAAFALKIPAAAGCLLTAGFAFFHGAAHGAEMPDTVHALIYGVGFLLSTALLLLNGTLFGLLMKQLNGNRIGQAAGAAIALSGLFLAFG